MKESKIVKAAKEAKKQGYEFISSVVKSHFNTVYYNVNSVEDIISEGKWIPAPRNESYGYRIGTSSVPENTISRVNAFRLVNHK